MAALAIGSSVNPELPAASPRARSVPSSSLLVANCTSAFHASDESEKRLRSTAIASASTGNRSRRAHHL